MLGPAAFMVQADARVIDPLLHVVAPTSTSPRRRRPSSSRRTRCPYGLFQLLYGPIGDRVGKLRVMAACLALFSFGTFACAFVPNIPVFALLRFLTGVVAAAVIPMSLGYIGDKFPYQDPQIALGRFMSALMIGQIAGSTLGGLFGQYLGWRYVFIVFGVAALAVSVLLAARGTPLPGTDQCLDRPSAAAILTVPAGGLLIFTGAGQRPAGRGRRSLARRPAAPSARLRAGDAVRRSDDAAAGAARARHRHDRGAVRLRRPGVSRLVADRPFRHQLRIRRPDGRRLRLRRPLLQRVGEETRVTASASWACCCSAARCSAWLRLHRRDARWHWFIPPVIFVGMGYYTMHGTLQTRATELAPEARGAAIRCLRSSSSSGRRPARNFLAVS